MFCRRHFMLAFDFAAQLDAVKQEAALNGGGGWGLGWGGEEKHQIEFLHFSFKYGASQKRGENPVDGIKDHKALLLLVPSAFKEMMWTIFFLFFFAQL